MASGSNSALNLPANQNPHTSQHPKPSGDIIADPRKAGACLSTAISRQTNTRLYRRATIYHCGARKRASIIERQPEKQRVNLALRPCQGLSWRPKHLGCRRVLHQEQPHRILHHIDPAADPIEQTQLLLAGHMQYQGARIDQSRRGEAHASMRRS